MLQVFFVLSQLDSGRFAHLLGLNFPLSPFYRHASQNVTRFKAYVIKGQYIALVSFFYVVVADRELNTLAGDVSNMSLHRHGTG